MSRKTEEISRVERKTYDTRLQRRARTLDQHSDEEVEFTRDKVDRRRKTSGQDKDDIQDRIIQGGELQVCENEKDVGKENFKSISTKKSMKSRNTSASTAERRKLEIELEADMKLLELKEKMILKKLALDKMKIDEEADKEDSFCDEIDIRSSNRNSEVEKWLKSCNEEDKATVMMDNIEKKELSRDECAEGRNLDMDGKFVNNAIAKPEVNFETCGFRRQTVDRSLPYFDGNPSEWLVFINEYHETTELCKYSDSENLIRLRKCLKGDARDAVKMLLISHRNVPDIIETLKNNYGRPEFVIRYLIDQVRQTPSPKDYRPDSIVKYANSLCNLVAAVKHLDSDIYLKNPLLVEEFVSNLTVSLKHQWAFHAVKLKEITLLELSDWLKDISRAASLLCNPKSERFATHKRSETVLMTNKNTNFETKCSCCDKTKHNLERCQKFQEMSVDERWLFVTKNKLCISCLKPNHRMNSCFAKRICGVRNCKLRHNNMLHKEVECQVPAETNRHDHSPEPVCVHNSPSEIILRTIPVNLEGPQGKILIYALLDEGSTITLLDNNVAKEIGLNGTVEPLCMQWTNHHCQTESNSRKVKLTISGNFSDAKSYNLTDVRTVDNLNLPLQSLDMKMIIERWPHLENIPVESFNRIRPKMLIGTDNYDLTMPRSFVEHSRYAPKATLTKLGWVINGQIIPGRIHNNFNFHICEKNFEDDMLHSLVKQSFMLNVDDVKDDDICISREDDFALNIMKQTTRRIGDRFETGLLWKQDTFIVPESKTMALNRLYCQERKMDRDRLFGEVYCQKINEYIAKGYLKELGQEEIVLKSEKNWYLPHFAVFNANKPGKLRLVFDAASKSHGLSLNDMLLSGPDLLTPLLNVLWTFRQRRIAFSADIAEMFHQVNIIKKVRTAQRILWRGFDRNREPSVLEMQVMTFDATCSPSLAQYVKNENASEYSKLFPKASDAIIRKHYVDDYLDSCDSEEESINLIKDVIYVHRKGGFHIRNWLSNSKNVLLNIPKDMRLTTIKDFSCDSDLPIERVLGIQWDPEKDEFRFKLNFGKISAKIDTFEFIPTKREVLRLVMSIFDPLGFLNDIIVKGRILLQEIWREKTEWDDKISCTLTNKWNIFLNELKLITNISIPRCYSLHIPISKSIQLHTFCDASEKAYAVVSYLRVESYHGVDVSFVSSRCKVCPLKAMTIPRLELQAALMGCKLAYRIKNTMDLHIDQLFFWTDSTIVLSWIRTEINSLKKFVFNRIKDILKYSDSSSWRWIPTRINSADEATRDMPRIKRSSTWLTGPIFLKEGSTSWPEEIMDVCNDKSEIKKEFLGNINCVQNLSLVLPDSQRFSSWLKLIRSTAWVLRFRKRCCKKICHSNELTVEELDEAERLWWKEVQLTSFKSELECIQTEDDIKGSRIQNLCPYVDSHGVMRVRSRIVSDILGFENNPVILDSTHNFTKLLVQSYHEKFNHQSERTIMNELRQKYWIVGLRNLVKITGRNCQKCKIMKSIPEIPRMGNLPIGRTTPYVRPFTHCGLDYFGPFLVKIGRRREKRYGVLFTCLAIRAIHLEIANSLTTDSTLMAIERMGARRGYPAELYSDNGTNLRGADKELQKAVAELNQETLLCKLTLKSIKWNFNPPTASHMGGVWERLIRSVKSSLKIIMKEHVPHEEVLHTLFLEVENIVNSRPLTDISLDSKDEEALTPNHFLLGPYYNQPLHVLKNYCSDEKFFKRQWKIVQDLSNKYWKRWMKEYLPSLHNRPKWTKENRKLKLDDVVIVADDQSPRNLWLKGIVVAIFPGKDGRVRVADIKTQDGVFRRPVSKLCILDVRRNG